MENLLISHTTTTIDHVLNNEEENINNKNVQQRNHIFKLTKFTTQESIASNSNVDDEQELFKFQLIQIRKDC